MPLTAPPNLGIFRHLPLHASSIPVLTSSLKQPDRDASVGYTEIAQETLRGSCSTRFDTGVGHKTAIFIL